MVPKRRHLLRYLFIAFFVLLAGLTLFSNTFQTMMLPKVTTENAVTKTLSHVIEGSGTVTYREQDDLLSETGTKVTKVHVNKNDNVKKGQVLLTFDNSAVEQQLLDEQDGLKKLLLDVDMQRELYIGAQREGDEDTVRKAKRELERQQLSVNAQQRKIDNLRSDLAKKYKLTAPYNGRIVDIKVKEGAIVPVGSTVLTLANPDEGFLLSFTTDATSSAFLQTGEIVKVNVKGEKQRTVEGTITEIKEGLAPDNKGNQGELGVKDDKQEDSKKTIVVAMKDSGLKGGEQASVHIEKPFKQQGLVLRKELIKEDSTGSYVFVIREKKSPLGNTYSVQKAYVKTGDETKEETIVLSGLYPNEDIVAETSEPLQEGNRVRLH